MNRIVMLAVIFAVLLGAMFLQRSRQRQVVVSAPAQTLTVNADRVSRLRIERQGEPAVVLSRVGGGWRVTEPFEYPAQDQMLETVLSSLKELKLQDVVSRNPDRRATYQVDSTGTHLQAWEGETSVLDVVVGKPSADYAHTYVRQASGDEVYRAVGTLTYNFNKKPDDWRDKTILKLTQSEISKVMLEYPQDKLEVVLTRVDSLWMCTSNQKNAKEVRADSLTVDRLLRNAATLNTVQFAAAAEAATLDFTKPEFTLRVETDSGAHTVHFVKGDATRLFAKLDGRDDVVFSVYESTIANLRKRPEDLKPKTS